MKISVSSIVRDHFKTLYAGDGALATIGDFLLFFGMPIAGAAFAWGRGFELKSDAYNLSITFFGIFIALLLNIQVAIFSIFQRKWTTPSDAREAKVQQKVVAARRALLEELNANISYLVLICCIALVAVLTFYVSEWRAGVAPAITILLYGHFLLTLLMIVKRSHALFQKEYRDSPE